MLLYSFYLFSLKSPIIKVFYYVVNAYRVHFVCATAKRKCHFMSSSVEKGHCYFGSIV